MPQPECSHNPVCAGITLCSGSACPVHEAVLPHCYCIPGWGRKCTLQHFHSTGGVQQSEAQHGLSSRIRGDAATLMLSKPKDHS